MLITLLFQKKFRQKSTLASEETPEIAESKSCFWKILKTLLLLHVSLRTKSLATVMQPQSQAPSCRNIIIKSSY